VNDRTVPGKGGENLPRVYLRAGVSQHLNKWKAVKGKLLQATEKQPERK
jgi:hypothetical protein